MRHRWACSATEVEAQSQFFWSSRIPVVRRSELATLHVYHARVRVLKNARRLERFGELIGLDEVGAPSMLSDRMAGSRRQALAWGAHRR